MNERAAAADRRTSRGARSRRRARPSRPCAGRDREFLPAALEILETPPAPLPVALMLTICAVLRRRAGLVVLRPARRPRRRAGQDRDGRAAPRSSSRSKAARSPRSTSPTASASRRARCCWSSIPPRRAADADSARDARFENLRRDRAPRATRSASPRRSSARESDPQAPRGFERAGDRPRRSPPPRQKIGFDPDVPDEIAAAPARRARRRPQPARRCARRARQADRAEGGDEPAPRHEHRLPEPADDDAERPRQDAPGRDQT